MKHVFSYTLILSYLFFFTSMIWAQATLEDLQSRPITKVHWQEDRQKFVINTAPIVLSLRAAHVGGNWGLTRSTVDNWKATGRTSKLLPLDYVQYLKDLHVNWIGLSVALHYDDSMDSTVERKYSDVSIPTFTDEVLVQLIQEFRRNGFNVYLTLAFEAVEAEKAARPVHRWQLGDTGADTGGVPPDPPEVFGVILPEFWPWCPNHPNHQRFVAEFWNTYTQQAVYFAKIAEAEGVRLFSLGTETDRLFRTRLGGHQTSSGGPYWSNHFGQELKSMVDAVRAVYSGLLTYDMHVDSLIYSDFFGPGSDHLWEDLSLDIVGLSAYFKLTDLPPTTVEKVENLEASWEQIFQAYLIPLQNRNPNRPIIFTEIGYTDSVGSPFNPASEYGTEWVFTDLDNNGQDDGQETQANIYQALFNVIDRHPGVINGEFLWESANIASNDQPIGLYREFSVRGKLAKEIVQSAYKIDISTPNMPSGPSKGKTGINYTYTTGGSSSNLCQTVEYQFEWKGDDSDLSNWGPATQSKAFTIGGIYYIRARARCAENISVVSDWSIPLTVSISIPEISVTPTVYDFGNVKVKMAKTAYFKVNNSGMADLLISTSIIGTDASMFKISSGSGNKTIKPGKTLTISVVFKPTSVGSKTSNLEITSNDPRIPMINIPLSGTGK